MPVSASTTRRKRTRPRTFTTNQSESKDHAHHRPNPNSTAASSSPRLEPAKPSSEIIRCRWSFFDAICLAIGAIFARRTARPTTRPSWMVVGCCRPTNLKMGPRFGHHRGRGDERTAGGHNILAPFGVLRGPIHQSKGTHDARSTRKSRRPIGTSTGVPSAATKWTDEWDCQGNDTCPKCSTETEPFDSMEIIP